MAPRQDPFPWGAFRYLKYRWDESRRDELDDWGKSWWFIELDSERYPTRQMEVYDDGSVLKYDSTLVHDRYGMLGDRACEDDDLASAEIMAEEFEVEWIACAARSRR